MLAERLEHTSQKMLGNKHIEKMLRTLVVRKNTSCELKLQWDYFTSTQFDDKDGHHQIAARHS